MKLVKSKISKKWNQFFTKPVKEIYVKKAFHTRRESWMKHRKRSRKNNWKRTTPKRMTFDVRCEWPKRTKKKWNYHGEERVQEYTREQTRIRWACLMSTKEKGWRSTDRWGAHAILSWERAIARSEKPQRFVRNRTFLPPNSSVQGRWR